MMFPSLSGPCLPCVLTRLLPSVNGTAVVIVPWRTAPTALPLSGFVIPRLTVAPWLLPFHGHVHSLQENFMLPKCNSLVSPGLSQPPHWLLHQLEADGSGWQARKQSEEAQHLTSNCPCSPLPGSCSRPSVQPCPTSDTAPSMPGLSRPPRPAATSPTALPASLLPFTGRSLCLSVCSLEPCPTGPLLTRTMAFRF